ncbi:MAG TPA: hypothetical protein VGQ20_06450 [Acidimicrobiales bacterium]|jgi:hypothetical protein|nr:hypothetical protein [Acidimicrobiales bacterium]
MTRPLEPPDPAKVRDAVLDVFVYAPIGFLFDAREVVPKLAERGRSQVTLARFFGRYALQRGQAEAERILARNRVTADTAPGAAPAAPPAPSGAVPDEVVPAAPSPRPSSRARTRAAAPAVPLAIPGYDSLSASQVVPRLDALLPDELEAVRQHETAHRGRRTILNRIAQLQG